jgi:leader peptidase (prepilin peptidase)/N-methyltransferase
MIELAFFGGLCALLTAAAIIDARTQRLPDVITLGIGLMGAAYVLVTGGEIGAGVLGAVLGYGLIWGVNALYRARRGHDGVGMGDAKLLAAGGLWIGWFGVPFVVLIGSSLALAVIGYRHLRGDRVAATDRIAFGPYLAAGIAGVAGIQMHLV